MPTFYFSAKSYTKNMIKEQAIKYIKSLSQLERARLKNMLSNGIVCCSGIAKDLKLDINDFNAELRRIFL